MRNRSAHRRSFPLPAFRHRRETLHGNVNTVNTVKHAAFATACFWPPSHPAFFRIAKYQYSVAFLAEAVRRSKRLVAGTASFGFAVHLPVRSEHPDLARPETVFGPPCHSFSALGFGLRVVWNRLGEAVKTRKKREKTGGKWARYGLKGVRESGSPGRQPCSPSARPPRPSQPVQNSV